MAMSFLHSKGTEAPIKIPAIGLDLFVRMPPAALSDAETARVLVAARLEQAYAAVGFEPPDPTWPFTDGAFESSVGFSARQLLKACDLHQQK